MAKKKKRSGKAQQQQQQQQPPPPNGPHKLTFVLVCCLPVLIFFQIAITSQNKNIIHYVSNESLGDQVDTGTVDADTPPFGGCADSQPNQYKPDTPTNQSSQQQQQKSTQSMFSSDWEMTKHFSQTYDSKGLYYRLKQSFDSSERAYDPSKRKTRLHPHIASRGGALDRTTRHKLLHDMEQFAYYCNNKDMKLKGQSLELFQKTLPAVYGATLQRLDAASKQGDFDEETEYYKFGTEDRDILHFYNRAMFMPPFGRLSNSDGDTASLLTPRKWTHVEQQWYGEDPNHANPGVVVIDNLLSPETLQRVREYLLVSTMWYEAKTPRYGNYLGAYLGDGMFDTLLNEVAFELHKAMPRVMKDHALKQMWSYKYESSPNNVGDEDESGRTGVHVHADDAMINVNIWLTPNEANLEPSSGGLVVYTMKPPPEWMDWLDFSDFNSNWENIDKYILRPSEYENVTIPYKQNRAVIFDSFLFHKTDRYRFKSGYENRRINLTFLYGDKQSNAIEF